MIAIVVVVILLVLVVGGFVVTYNGLVRRRNGVDNAWAQVDVQLRRRYDLIPNLVQTVKGYAKHERETFEAVTQARASAVNAQGPAQQAQAEGALSSTLRSLFAVAEAYPGLKADQNFRSLQDQLSDTETRIAAARQFYNDATVAYNNATQTFPANVVARMGSFPQRQYFSTDGEARGPVAVSF